jgi:hypothetical protein
MPNVIMLNVENSTFILSVIILSIILLNGVILSVVAPV